jgi:hypothetical protein
MARAMSVDAFARWAGVRLPDSWNEILLRRLRAVKVSALEDADHAFRPCRKSNDAPGRCAKQNGANDRSSSK